MLSRPPAMCIYLRGMGMFRYSFPSHVMGLVAIFIGLASMHKPEAKPVLDHIYQVILSEVYAHCSQAGRYAKFLLRLSQFNEHGTLYFITASTQQQVAFFTFDRPWEESRFIAREADSFKLYCIEAFHHDSISRYPKIRTYYEHYHKLHLSPLIKKNPITLLNIEPAPKIRKTNPA